MTLCETAEFEVFILQKAIVVETIEQVYEMVEHHMEDWADNKSIQALFLNSVEAKTDITCGSLLIEIKFKEHSTRSRSHLFRIFHNGRLLQKLKSLVLTDEFRKSITDVSDLNIEDSSTRQQLQDVLHTIFLRMSLRLSVNLQKMVSLLFNSSCTSIMVTVTTEAHKPAVDSIDEALDEVFPVLSEMLLRPLNDIDMTEEQSK